MGFVNIPDRLLSGVEKPARYTGAELNMTDKTDGEFRFALCFPDVYEIGMSHLGSRILYHILNSREDTICERVYAPWTDMEQAMRQHGVPLFTLETKRPVVECDALGFSLLYEMCYSNILTMLDLAGIPFDPKRRGEDIPIVLCGGPCACNPEPIAPFMDAVMIGDGEQMIQDVVETLLACKRQGLCREDRLRRLSQIEGVYVPSLYEAEYDADGMYAGLRKLDPSAPDTVARRVVRDLDAAPYLGRPIVPYISIVHDRVALEVFRGCTRGCRFCQAGFIYRPVRERKLGTLLEQARELVACTGYDEVSLFSLSTGDYSGIHELVPAVMDEFADKRVSVSLPSLRIDAYLKDDLARMRGVRKAGLTFAPEAGTQRLRDVINKGVDEDDLLRSVTDAFEAGWDGVKLYFMIGLPTETDEDILGIAELARKVSRRFYEIPKEKRGKGLRLSVSASSFVPKPFTPFQWESQDTKEELIRKQRLLRDALRGVRGVEFSYHAPDVSVLEAVFARGDRRLAAVLESAWKRGARFDSWDERFDKSAWDGAFAQTGVDPAFYANRPREADEKLPWEHIDMLVTADYLKKEREAAYRASKTGDCRQACKGCFGKKYADYCKVL
ncbi:MAG TPA: TIGR03960 family B12-binding radical SAM protein [Clostridia bacterium]|nr:TIGR03960 family B12-binding radical SAM protein [Clostridia bacterium]HPK14927.1 TIGR03960 family B12-binding radical SAM protein [Clostridia bacterium]